MSRIELISLLTFSSDNRDSVSDVTLWNATTTSVYGSETTSTRDQPKPAVLPAAGRVRTRAFARSRHANEQIGGCVGSAQLPTAQRVQPPTATLNDAKSSQRRQVLHAQAKLKLVRRRRFFVNLQPEVNDSYAYDERWRSSISFYHRSSQLSTTLCFLINCLYPFFRLR